jgi:hypothetical protein
LVEAKSVATIQKTEKNFHVMVDHDAMMLDAGVRMREEAVNAESSNRSRPFVGTTMHEQRNANDREAMKDEAESHRRVSRKFAPMVALNVSHSLNRVSDEEKSHRMNARSAKNSVRQILNEQCADRNTMRQRQNDELKHLLRVAKRPAMMAADETMAEEVEVVRQRVV